MTAPVAHMSSLCVIRPIGFGELAAVRMLQAQAFRHNTAPHMSEDLAARYEACLQGRSLGAMIDGEGRFVGAWIDRTLVATGHWAPAPTASDTARMTDIFVHALFTGHGLGRLMLQVCESHAAKAGYSIFSAQAPLSTAPFFERHGYRIISRGVNSGGTAPEIPVVFLRKEGRGGAVH